MPNAAISQIVVPVNVGGTITNTTYDIKDAEARERLAGLASALYWIGVTTSALSDGVTTNPISIGGNNVTASAGAVAQYDTIEFVWNGSAWQELGRGDLGALAFKNSASTTYTPAGTVNIQRGSDTPGSATLISNYGTLPSFSYDGTTETLTFDRGALAQGTDATFVTDVGEITSSTFSGTQATITVS